MTNTAEAREILVGIDPARDCHMQLAWAADDAHRRRRPLRLLVAVPAPHHVQHVDASTRMKAQLREGERATAAAASWVRERHDDVEVATDVLDGHPAHVLIRQSGRARMIVLGSRHLSRTEEFLSAGSLVVPVSAQARCPVAVVGDAEHVTQETPYLVVGVDGSESSGAALALAFEEASLRGATLRALWVWQPPVLFSLKDEPTLVQTQRSLLSETVALLGGEVPGRRAHARSAGRTPGRGAGPGCRARLGRGRGPQGQRRLHGDAAGIGGARTAAPCPLPGHHRPCHVKPSRPPHRVPQGGRIIKDQNRLSRALRVRRLPGGRVRPEQAGTGSYREGCGLAPQPAG